ncbi:MAG: hypothetical protein IJA10_05935 [Lachnospiraceae bacterium]|nr:hypothetical protein [Lachnospiraceae bacterium]
MKNKTKKMLKKISKMIVITVLASLLTTPICVQAADWYKDNTGWWWQEDDGSYPVSKWEKIGGKWYHFNAVGYMDTGWYKEGGNWYYLGGVNDGAMKTGWQLVDGLYYYMYSDGRMAANTWVDQYYVGANGAWVPNPSSGGTYAVNNKNGKIHIVGECFATGNGSNAMTDAVYFNTYDDALEYSQQIFKNLDKRNCGNCW